MMPSIIQTRPTSMMLGAAAAVTAALLGGCQVANSQNHADLMVLTDQLGPAAQQRVGTGQTADGSGWFVSSAGEPQARTTRATLPVNIRIVWVEREGGDGSWSPTHKFGGGRAKWTPSGQGPQFVTVRDTPELEVLLQSASARLRSFKEVAGAAPLRGIELTKPMQGDALLRAAAERTKGDLLIIATGQWTTDSDSIPLTQLLTIGLAPTKWQTTEATAEAVLLDVRGGEVLYRWSVQADASQLCNTWTAGSAAKDAATRAQRRLMEGLLTTLENRWPDVIATIKQPLPARAGR